VRTNLVWGWLWVLAVAGSAVGSRAQGDSQKKAAGYSPGLSAVSASRIIAPHPGYHFPDGETSTFTVEWHSLNAGSASIKMEAVDNQQQVTAAGHTAGLGHFLYKVDDHFQSRFDPETFCSLAISKHSEEGARRRQTDSRFDYSTQKSVLEEKNLKTGEQKHIESNIPGCVTDILSGFYYLASLPLQPGTSTQFSMSDGGKTTDVSAYVESREQVKVAAGTFQTVRVRAEPVSGPLKGRGTVWIWYTDGPDHTPVQMRAKLGWGTLLFRLQSREK
jgi:hypothetical protein